jgi:hypothetical protein
LENYDSDEDDEDENDEDEKEDESSPNSNENNELKKSTEAYQQKGKDIIANLTAGNLCFESYLNFTEIIFRTCLVVAQ